MSDGPFYSKQYYSRDMFNHLASSATEGDACTRSKDAKDYKYFWNFPHCVGSVDGKHVLLQAGANSSSQFFNYKKHSANACSQ